MTASNSLGNDAFLSKIDRLRATNVGSLIPLPQVIVVGDQSSGKSSALESLTGFAFPRAATLCTRYATQISCIRAPEKRVVVSIIPRMDASDELKTRLQAFRRQLDTMDDAALAQIFHDANAAMGIRMEGDDDDDGISAFSEDILKIDIDGPDQTHLTLIDVPGIFRIPTPGLTTDSDIQLVRNMVKRYMENSRTIILAVIPCNVDIANQEILRLAAEADPDGLRTMGVLTKPDLATERATQDAVLELLNGQRNALKLGYCVIKNRSADDHSSSAAERLASERAFFQAPPWSTCNDSTALGTDALRTLLRGLVLDISKRELPHVRSEIESRRRTCAQQLAALGSPRSSELTQRQYLVEMAVRGQDITKSALNGYYAGDNGLFQKQPALRLITKLIRLNETFADTFWKKGHVQYFRDSWSDDGETMLIASGRGSSGEAEEDPTNKPGKVVGPEVHEDLSDIIVPEYDCPAPKRGPLTELIREVYMESRGPELGTFNGTVLASVFTEVTKKWEPLVLDHASKAIALVHDYIRKLLDELCSDQTVRDQLWDVLLRDELRNRYRSVMAHAQFILHIERSGLPMTFNHYFNSTVQKKRHAHLVDKLKKHAKKMVDADYMEDGRRYNSKTVEYVPLDKVETMTVNMDNSEHVCEDLLDAVESYYKVSRKRFIDTFYQHVVYDLLLTGPHSPLKILSPGRILQLTASELSNIASEDAITCNKRQVLGRQLESLEEAIEVLAAR